MGVKSATTGIALCQIGGRGLPFEGIGARQPPTGIGASHLPKGTGKGRVSDFASLCDRAKLCYLFSEYVSRIYIYIYIYILV